MIYKFKAGSHYSTIQFPSFLFWNNITKTKVVKFSDTCMYDDEGKSGQINKLFGFSQGFPHQANYLLIGWRSRKDLGGIELLPYMHFNYEKIYYQKAPQYFIPEEVATPFIINDFNKSTTITISTKDPKYYTFTAGSKVWHVLRGNKPWFPIGYTLKPYFGGQKPAPHEMYIDMV